MIILQTKKHTYQRVYWYVVCLMVLVCTSFSHALSATYAPNMGSQGITVHNNHHLGQVDNVFDVAFAQNNLNNNALVEQGSMQQENDLVSLPLLVPSSSFFSNELPHTSSLPSNGLNNNAVLNDQVSMGWDQRSIRNNPSPCFTQLTTTPLYPSLENSYNNPLVQNTLNHGQQRNSGFFNDGASIRWYNNTLTDFNASPCFSLSTTIPFDVLVSNYNNPLTQKNLSSYKDLNIPLPTFRSQEQPSIGLQERRSLATPYLSELTTTTDNQLTSTADARAILPATLSSSQQKKGRFVCDMCGKSFTQKCNLKTHIKGLHSKEKHYQCHYCPKKFSQKIDLKRHSFKHTGERPYSCPLCKKSFIRNDKLKRHVQEFHIKKKSFVCVGCGESYTQKGSLVRHMKSVHMKEKLYKCSQCNQTFTRKDSLTKHIKNLHQNKNKYRCPQCKRKFTSQHNVDIHVRTFHNKKN